MSLMLKAQIIVTGKCTSSSKQQLVKTLKTGDTLEVSVDIAPKRRCSGLQATYVSIKNLTQSDVESCTDSMTMISKLLDKIPHTVIDND